MITDVGILGLICLFLAAGMAGAMNSVAGGGTFITFPAMVFFGMNPLIANTTSTVALWPASISGAYGFRKHLAEHSKRKLLEYIVVSLAGGVCGAVLLVITPPTVFEKLVPWLILLATTLFAGSGRITAYAKKHPITGRIDAKWTVAASLAAQFMVALYGGYFGAGIGIMMLALFSLFGLSDTKAINALKTLLATSINSVAVITFIAKDLVDWRVATVMLMGAVPAGYLGAKLAMRLSERVARSIIISIGCIITVAFFAKYYT